VSWEIEWPPLRPLPRTGFPFSHEVQRTVNRDGHLDEALGDGDLDDVQPRRRP
jgi:hypothetical protein